MWLFFIWLGCPETTAKSVLSEVDGWLVVFGTRAASRASAGY